MEVKHNNLLFSLVHVQPPVYGRGDGYRPYHMARQRVRLRDIIEDDRDEGMKKRRSFCRSWCEMWFLLAQSSE